MRNLALDTPENRKILIEDNNLPALEHDGHFHISSEATTEYNCIAWAMGFNDRWVDHIPGDGKNLKKWWPEGVPRDFHPDCLIKAFEAVGFECCSDDSTEEGYEKVALFKMEPFYCRIDPYTILKFPVAWTHAAKVLSQDTYHSKMGPLFDIYHGSGDVLQSSYGKIFQFMRRRVEDKKIIDQIIAQELGISIPSTIVEDVLAKLDI